MHTHTIGWDIGGAHIKAAEIDQNNKVTQVWQMPCPLWKGLNYLTSAVSQIIDQITAKDCVHAVTMTGELVDLFDSREQGVAEIILALETTLNTQKILLYAGIEGFIEFNKLTKQHYSAIASANWLASSSYAASQTPQALFIDIGSTTTDLLILADKTVKAQGFTDYQRLQCSELLYTGIVRTPVMAIAQSAYFRGHSLNLMAEHFATMADVYRLTVELDEAHDQTETADGAEKSCEASARRLSRMTGYDYRDDEMDLWRQFADEIKAQQLEKIRQAVRRQLSRHLITPEAIFIGAGVGRFLVRQIAYEMNYKYLDYGEFISHLDDKRGLNVADCAPAVAVALLVNVI